MNSTAAFDKVRIARANNRPTALEYITRMLTGFIELHGDRAFADDHAVVGGLGFLNGRPVTVIGIEKGRAARERVERNFGSPHPEGYRKALRLMRQAERFHRPVLCLVDTSGAYCGIGAEERGQGEAIARNIMEMSALKTPVLSLLIGEGGSGGALGLAMADRVWMLENAIYSVISPEGCASILWKDAARAADAAQSLKLTAEDALRFHVIERIVPEKELGSDAYFEGLRDAIAAEFDGLLALSPEQLTDARYRRFRRIGTESLIGAEQDS